ncbi:hypothetical protein ABPG75_002664 [Micractinium tetrahymenae]
MHINDWAAIQTLFDKLNKQLERTQKVGGLVCKELLGPTCFTAGLLPAKSTADSPCGASSRDQARHPSAYTVLAAIIAHLRCLAMPMPVQVTQTLGVPRAYVRMMCELEDFLNKTLAGEGALHGRPLNVLGTGVPTARCSMLPRALQVVPLLMARCPCPLLSYRPGHRVRTVPSLAGLAFATALLLAPSALCSQISPS